MKASFDKVLSASHAAGIEVVSPMLSQGMIDLASELDWRSCLDLENLTGKLPLRQLLGKYCCFQSGSKQGFGSPMGRWLAGPLRELFEESVLRRESLGGLELNTAGMRAVFENQIKGKEDRSWGLWIFLSLALWEDAHESW
jgi:asparagine synthase (glutamine-hydrolysing)